MSSPHPTRSCAMLAAMLLMTAGTGRAAAQEFEAGRDPPPFEILEELAGILGQAHAIRALCNGEGDQTWRAYMMEMLRIESPNGSHRSTLTSAFNRGYRAQSRRSKTCNADLASFESELANRGRMLSDTIARIYLE